jgi:exodeoxyribonuclease VII small subunit
MAQVDFEKALAKLEKIVAEMETDELSLDQMLAKFKEGVALAAACSKRLHEAERTIEIVTKNAEGGVETKPFETGADKGANKEDEESEADEGP